MPSYASPTYASRRRSSERSPSPTVERHEHRSPFSPASSVKLRKAAAAALESTPPRTPTSERSSRLLSSSAFYPALHHAVSPQELAAGARLSAKRGARILRLEAEAAARRAAALELEEVRGAISQQQRDLPRVEAAPTPSPAQTARPVEAMRASPEDGAAASTLAAWAGNMRARLADKDDELAAVCAALAEERDKTALVDQGARASRRHADTVSQEAEELRPRLLAAEEEIAHLRAALSTSTLGSEQVRRQNADDVAAQWKIEREADQGRELAAVAQLQVANLKQRCEAAEHMLWLTETKAETDEKAWLEWKAAALTRIELLQEAVDSHEGSPPKQQSAAPRGVRWDDSVRRQQGARSDNTRTTQSNASAAEHAATNISGEHDWPWEDDDEDGYAAQAERARQRPTQEEQAAAGANGEEDELDDDDNDDDDDENIWKLRDELAVLNAKVKGLEDELEDELEDNEEDQVSMDQTSEESEEREREREKQRERIYAAGLDEDEEDSESWLFESGPGRRAAGNSSSTKGSGGSGVGHRRRGSLDRPADSPSVSRRSSESHLTNQPRVPLLLLLARADSETYPPRVAVADRHGQQ